MALVWFRRAEVCLHLPGRPMAPGQPARAPIPPSLAVCVERPFGFHALTVWISRRRSMTWAIGDLCRFSLLNLGSLGRFFAQNFVLSALSAFRHLRLPCLSLCARGVTGHSPNAQGWLWRAGARRRPCSLCVFECAVSALRRCAVTAAPRGVIFVEGKELSSF